MLAVRHIIGPGIPFGSPVLLSCRYTFITLCISSVVSAFLSSIANVVVIFSGRFLMIAARIYLSDRSLSGPDLVYSSDIRSISLNKESTSVSVTGLIDISSCIRIF